VRFSGEGDYSSNPFPDEEYLSGSLANAVDLNRATVVAVGSFDPGRGMNMIGLVPGLESQGYQPFQRSGYAPGGLEGSHNDGDGAFSPPHTRLQTSPIAIDANHHIFANVVDKTATSMKLFLDGVNLQVDIVGTNAGGGSNAALDDVTRVELGGYFPGSAHAGGWLGGDIAEILVFDNVLTDDELVGITHILGERWGLTVPAATIAQIAAAMPLVLYNGDGVFDAADYTVWRDSLGQNVTQGTGADGNGDGFVGLHDYGFWKDHFGNGPATIASSNTRVPGLTDRLQGARFGQEATALQVTNLPVHHHKVTVPEPGSITLLGIGAVSVLGYSWRRQKLFRS
jgi:hypothetical protein